MAEIGKLWHVHQVASSHGLLLPKILQVPACMKGQISPLSLFRPQGPSLQQC